MEIYIHEIHFFCSLALSGYLHYLFVLFPRKGFRVPVGYNAESEPVWTKG